MLPSIKGIIITEGSQEPDIENTGSKEKRNKSRIQKTANVQFHKFNSSPSITGVMKSGREWRPLKTHTD